MKPTTNRSTNNMRKDMAYLRMKMGLVLKYVRRDIEKVNFLNYFTRTPPRAEKCYYEEDAYVVND